MSSNLPRLSGAKPKSKKLQCSYWKVIKNKYFMSGKNKIFRKLTKCWLSTFIYSNNFASTKFIKTKTKTKTKILSKGWDCFVHFLSSKDFEYEINLRNKKLHLSMNFIYFQYYNTYWSILSGLDPYICLTHNIYGICNISFGFKF